MHQAGSLGEGRPARVTQELSERGAREADPVSRQRDRQGQRDHGPAREAHDVSDQQALQGERRGEEHGGQRCQARDRGADHEHRGAAELVPGEESRPHAVDERAGARPPDDQRRDGAEGAGHGESESREEQQDRDGDRECRRGALRHDPRRARWIVSVQAVGGEAEGRHRQTRADQADADPLRADRDGVAAHVLDGQAPRSRQEEDASADRSQKVPAEELRDGSEPAGGLSRARPARLGRRQGALFFDSSLPKS